MNRLEEFMNSFINIVLSILVTLILSWMFFPKAIGFEDSKSFEDWFFMACLGLFVIKYLHESSVASFRFPKVETLQPHGFWPLGLFISKFGVPIILCLIIGKFVFSPVPRGYAILWLAGFAAIFHGVLYLIPDEFIRKRHKPNWEENFPWKDVPEIWLKIDISVIFFILLAGIIFIILDVCGGLDPRTTWAPKFAKVTIGLIYSIQSITDWIWNKSFFFE